MSNVDFSSEQEVATARVLKEAIDLNQDTNDISLRIKDFLAASFRQIRPNLSSAPFSISLFTLANLVKDVDGKQVITAGFSSLVAMSLYWGRVSVLQGMFDASGYDCLL
jgi:hypothetical protein